MEKEDIEAGLQRIATEGAHVRELMKHPGMLLLKQKLEKEAGKDYRKWALETDRDKAEPLRLRAQGYELFFSFAKEFMLRGDQAFASLNQRKNQRIHIEDTSTINDQPPA